MQQGVAPWRKPWDGSGGGHHCNLISGHRYRGSNPILLTLGMHIRGSAMPFWCGYAEARQLGIRPKKGSKAAMILRPQLHQQAEEPGAGRREQADGAEGASRSWVSYRPVPVFNASDLEGPGLAELISARQEAAGQQARPEPERLAAAEAVLSAWPVPVSFGGDRAFYLPQLDRIQLPERASFDSPLLAPMRNVAAIENCNRGIDAMAREEAAYWLGMAMHRKNPRRELAALRLLLSAS
jgi:antirestriction protein ArdC